MTARTSETVEAEALSACYSIDTAVNLWQVPRWNPSSLGAVEAEKGNRYGTVPTLSSSVLAFLAARHEDVVALANKPVVKVPEIPDDLPLKRYFISSSHNTYLLSWQLLGRSSAAAYSHVLLASAPARCVEIDVWWDGRPRRGIPVVTHGWTLSKSVPFVDVCMAIGQAAKRISDREDGNDWPIFVSLECHVPLIYQDELVRIMSECWGDMLVQGEIERLRGETVTPRQLRGRIVLMVEYYPGELDQATLSDADHEGIDGEPWVMIEGKADRNPCSAVDNVDAVLVYPKIADSLANLGFYARSMKPPTTWWIRVFPSPPYPPNVAINVNERRIPGVPHILSALQKHATYHLRRVYPNGLRVTSSNLDPLVQWRSGTHMACLNWQKWDEAMWLNEAMFGGTGGWIVRPDPELPIGLDGGSGGKQWRFKGRVVGLSALPRPEGDQQGFVGYCQAELFHRDGKHVWVSRVARARRDVAPVSTVLNDMVHLTWKQTFKWTFDVDALTFLLLKIVRRHALKRDETVAVFCARLDQLASGLCLVRMLDMKGKYVGATLLCEFSLVPIETDI